ncbi:hypothetical protein AB8Z38_07390 [Bradyrhizobium sp. LLZ17]|uniref:Uncharacterized protein n=1 Tax=Bradyrhizobium sp. LLZ17 TaxID=3239388 RepID=A0AB39XP74_9BRAD
MPRLQEIHQRDDKLFELVCGDAVAGPFPSYLFAEPVAEGTAPEPKLATKFRRYKIVREVLHLA